ncbi:MAG: hypothetical protein D6832_00785 [Alphaproteobacteria bacterium]|nr:MAG: hypothetical protein D6832_00785 [Alphaproteobacteria bacterium]
MWLAPALGDGGRARAAELIMIAQQGCYWCETWDAEIGPVYPKTEEGRRAPLRRIDITEFDEGSIAGAGPVQFTPTFILVEDGREIGRIEGYPGEDFFWGLLDQMLTRLPAAGTEDAAGAPRAAAAGAGAG